ncbi:MAG: NUDIX domain-containing protein [Pseudomonadota bacterium]
MSRPLRLAVRALILNEGKLLLVNAWKDKRSVLLCAPGGGVEMHQSLPDNLKREVYEETGLTVRVGDVALVNEFHAPERDFHQVDIYFRCQITGGIVTDEWADPEGVVHTRRWVSESEISSLQVKPDSLAAVAWGTGITYDPLEPLVR